MRAPTVIDSRRFGRDEPRHRGLRAVWRVVRTLVFIVALAMLVYLWPVDFGGNSSIVFVSGDSMQPTLDSDDLVLVREADSYHVGDLVVLTIPEGQAGAGSAVIHRIVGGSSSTGWVTRGDNREYVDQWFLHDGDIVGRVRLVEPWGTEARVAISMLLWPVTWAVAAAAVSFTIAWRLQNRLAVDENG